jgi:hypothetical protein
LLLEFSLCAADPDLGCQNERMLITFVSFSEIIRMPRQPSNLYSFSKLNFRDAKLTRPPRVFAPKFPYLPGLSAVTSHKPITASASPLPWCACPPPTADPPPRSPLELRLARWTSPAPLHRIAMTRSPEAIERNG